MESSANKSSFNCKHPHTVMVKLRYEWNGKIDLLVRSLPDLLLNGKNLLAMCEENKLSARASAAAKRLCSLEIRRAFYK